jgi:hypothetical protein
MTQGGTPHGSTQRDAAGMGGTLACADISRLPAVGRAPERSDGAPVPRICHDGLTHSCLRCAIAKVHPHGGSAGR